MQIESFSTDTPDTHAALAEAAGVLGQGADFVFVAANADHDAAVLQAGLGSLRAVHGVSSCMGAMTEGGHSQSAGLCLFVLRDPDGDYGSAAEALGDDPQHAAATATSRALEAAGRLGEIPDVVWVTATPGAEEDVIAGIEEVVGKGTPIIGGSAADNSVEGQWYTFDNAASAQSGVTVSVLFPSGRISYAYQSGYAPTAQTGHVTAVAGRRVTHIDDTPAFEVLQGWSGNSLPAPRANTPANILSAATLWPLGRAVSTVQGIPNYLLAHPAVAHPDGSVDLFANVAQGETITQMTGTTDALASRAGRVATQACQDTGQPVGALMVYCGGCMLSLRDKLNVVTTGTASALQGAPFVGLFSFGEQGPVTGSGNRHGNLMISCLVFWNA